ncbi:MAG: DNA primase [Nitrosopumilus sp. H13]|nr:MAG: DNA primase [Nitrosopumilus sp. H13]
MNETDVVFLEGLFKKYYFEHFDLIKAPERASEREFGYQRINSGMNRHISLADDEELRLLLAQNIPSDVYCSNACYAFPAMPMKEKDWKEADLIFDIDSKDLALPCRASHTVYVCNECARASNADKCAHCGSAKTEKKSLPCDKCIDASKKEVEKLRNILTDDLGVADDMIEVYFSGNEGFHVYAFDAELQKTGSKERSQLADYIMFNGIIPETMGMKRHRPDRSLLADLGERGWRGRFARDAYGSKTGRTKAATQMKKDPDGYSKFESQLADSAGRIGVKIDPNVTTDIHRIFRMPGSINSKSGLSKIRCSRLDGFDPYAEAALLDDVPAEVSAECPVKFSLGGQKFGPYERGRITVPAYAAAYMICKKLATTA